jgi:hypothetical protein
MTVNYESLAVEPPEYHEILLKAQSSKLKAQSSGLKAQGS